MIQELLGGAGLIGERKISIAGVLEGSSPSLSPSPSPSLSPSPSPTSSSAAAAPPSSASASDNQNQLRCPRCDSTNTKFCYYNNYNLTQPRHFCKTCRRYWTKGGALRNVPIGGGCRKNKNVSVAATVGIGKPTAGRLKCSTDQIGKSGLLLDGFNQEVAPNPILWASPQNSHLLALLRANQNTNPNPNPNHISNSITVKEESPMIGSHMNPETAVTTGGLNARVLGSDPFNQVASVGLCNPFWRSNQHRITQQQQQQQQQQQNGFVLGEVQNSSGIQDLYQRLRSSANYYPVHSQVLLSNVGSSSSSSSSIFESAPVVTSEMTYWNPPLSWSELPTANGAYP